MMIQEKNDRNNVSNLVTQQINQPFYTSSFLDTIYFIGLKPNVGIILNEVNTITDTRFQAAERWAD